MSGSKLFLSVVVTLCLCGAGVVFAQDEGGAPAPSIQPAEIYGCQFQDGQGWAQLQHVTARWNEWMDSRGDHGYWAYLLAPMYHSDELAYDVLWAGGWMDGASMAAGLEGWMNDGGEIGAEFSRVVDCSTVTNFATLALATPEPPHASGPVEFSNCKVEEGHEFPEALAAAHAWIDYQAEHGVTGNNFFLFPAFGGPQDGGYDFKWVTASSWEAFGKSYDQYGTGGGWQKAEELFKGVLKCDSARLYNSTRVREMTMGE
jgi:hypothetical protein